ncbi:hypothetical protein M0R88_10290 [Halorussus gelatinilyticus]|uniref:Uncharacterized protein n=1 Tax=Halorussus gelatinilyticus TaxID=2937524 RepID=A0A8U0ICZ9_9EURY|nr:hypothetical protein [Halorussus gelatinilyticus]UPV98919.1 hypothetical protein M0R88_10290 [Halorussus gelatinilyticus]
MTNQLSRMQGQTSNGQMGAIGYVIAAGVALILLPVLPFVALLWLAVKFGGSDGRRGAYGG